MAVADGWRDYYRVGWAGGFAFAAPKRVNCRAGDIVNDDGDTASRVENLRISMDARKMRKDCEMSLCAGLQVVAQFRRIVTRLKRWVRKKDGGVVPTDLKMEA